VAQAEWLGPKVGGCTVFRPHSLEPGELLQQQCHYDSTGNN